MRCAAFGVVLLSVSLWPWTSRLSAGEPVACVRVEDGSPQLYVHGERTPALLFWTSSPMGSVRLDGGRLLLSHPRGSVRTSVRLRPGRPIVVEARAAMHKPSTPDATVCVSAAEAASACYYIGLQYLPGGNRIKLWKRNRGGEWETWFTVPHSWKMGQTVALRLVVDGGHVAGYADGKLIAEKDDPKPLRPTAAELGAYRCEGEFFTARVAAGKTLVADGLKGREGGLAPPWETRDGAAGRIRAFARHGIHLFSYGVSMGEWWRGPGRYDFSPVAARLEALRHADPKSLALLRVGINPPDWWIAKHPAEQMVVANREDRRWKHRHASMSSEPWRKEAGEALGALIEHFTASPLARHVLGWHFGAGDCGEWAYAWGECCADYSPAQLAAFRRWLRKRYKTAEALRAAWNNPKATFETAAVPPPQRRYRGEWGELFDPAKSRDVVDYLRFHSETVADAIVGFARVARKASRGQHLVGAFYGYSIPTLWRPAAWHNSGHHALARVLASPDLDFICDPYVYRDRHPGQACVPQTLPEAIRLAGKLHLLEDDTRTFLTKDDPRHAFGRCPDLATTIGVLRRNWAAAATQSGGLWWMEQGAGWFQHPDVLADLGRLRGLHARLAPSALRSNAEIAVVVSQKSQPFMAQTPNLVLPLVTQQIVRELSFVGAPFDLILASDVGRARDYRLTIFPASYYVPEAERTRIRALHRAGRTFLWLHAPGLMAEGATDAASSSALTGIRLRLAQIGGTAHVRITDRANPLTRGLPAGTVYGTDRRIAPLLEAVDPEATVLGTAFATSLNVHDGVGWALPTYARPGLVAKTVDGARVIFSATGPVPAPLLRNVAREAGVHLYDEAGDVVYASRGLVAIHYASSGPRTLRFPPGKRIRDPWTGRELPSTDGKLRVNARLGHTDIFLLD